MTYSDDMLKKLAAFAAATNNELFDPDYNGGEWLVDAIETHETLEQFEQSSKGWATVSPMKTGHIAGMPYRAWPVAQAMKGQPRQAISVVDFGDVRIALPGTNLSMFI